MNRRNFSKLLFVGFLLFSSNAQPYFIEKLIGKANPQYIKEYFSRMWSWHNKEFSDLSKKITKKEMIFFLSWKSKLMNWGREVDNNFYRDSFSFIHRIKGEKVSHSGFFISQKEWSSDQILLLKIVLDERNIKINKTIDFSNLTGVEWDFDQSLLTLFFNNHQDKSIMYVTFKNDQFYDQGEITLTKDYKKPLELMIEADILSVHKISSQKSGDRLHFRFKAFYVPLLSQPAYNISRRHFQEFHQPMDSIEIVSKDEYRIFYP